jgi:hypothetical protein
VCIIVILENALNGLLVVYSLNCTSVVTELLKNSQKFAETHQFNSFSDGAFASLFDKKTGILPFIQRALKQDAFVDAIKESFILLKELIDVFKGRMSCHVLQIKVRELHLIVCAITLSKL